MRDRCYKALRCWQRDMCLSLIGEAGRERQSMVQSANLHGRHFHQEELDARDLGAHRILVSSHRHLHDFTERAPEQNLESWDPPWIYYNSPCDFQEVTSHLCAFVSFSPR